MRWISEMATPRLWRMSERKRCFQGLPTLGNVHVSLGGEGIGLETAKLLAAKGRHLLVHGRSPTKLEALRQTPTEISDDGPIGSYAADLSDLVEVEGPVSDVKGKNSHLDVLIHHPGVYKTPQSITSKGLDVRYIVHSATSSTRLRPICSSSGYWLCCGHRKVLRQWRRSICLPLTPVH